MLTCVLSIGHGLCHSFQLLVEIKALNSYFFSFLCSTHPVAWHLMAGPFKAERCGAYGSMCRMAENWLPLLQMVNTDTLWYRKAA